MKWPQNHQWLKDLPVSKSLDNYNIDENFCLVAATGSGKTMVIGPAINLTTGRKIIIRQPTRQIAWLVYRSLSEFWDGVLKVGIRTSEKKVGTIDENDITVVTDGVMRNILLDRKEQKFTVIFDEAHWMHEPTEIELGIVKTLMNQGYDINCVLLSATVRPSNFIRYFENSKLHYSHIETICDALLAGTKVNDMHQPQKMKCYYAEGVMFPVQKFIIHLDNNLCIEQFCQRMLDDGKRGLVFLTTRKEVANAKELFGEKFADKEIEFEFCHADRNVDDIKKWVEDNNISVLFSTVSMATSATLPFDEVLIIDRGLESDWVDDMPILKTNQPIDSNGIIQRAGRVGRTKPGKAFLNTNHKIAYGSAKWLRTNWDDINPSMIKPPLESMPLDMVVLTCAAYEMNLDELDVMSRLSEKELHEISQRMQKAGIIEIDGGKLKLTKLGLRINGMQMGVWPAYSLCRADKDMQLLILASQTGPNLFGLFDSDQARKEWSNKNRDYKSFSGFKAGLMREALSMTKSERKEWCETNGLSVKRLEGAIYDFKDKAKKSLGFNPRKIAKQLTSTEVDFEQDLIEHNNRNRMQKQFIVSYDYRWGYNGNVSGNWAMCSKDEIEILKIPLGGTLTIRASPKKITTKKGKEMIILEDITLVDAYD